MKFFTGLLLAILLFAGSVMPCCQDSDCDTLRTVSHTTEPLKKECTHCLPLSICSQSATAGIVSFEIDFTLILVEPAIRQSYTSVLPTDPHGIEDVKPPIVHWM